MDDQLPPAIIGRLSAFGLVDVALYLVVLVISALAANRARIASSYPGRRKDARFWGIVAFTILLLGLWKAFDIEGMLHDMARLEAERDGVYAGRRLYQGVLVTTGMLGGVALLVMTVKRFRRRHPAIRLAAAALALLIVFVSVRTASLHVIDRLIYDSVGPLRLNWVAEPGLLLCVAIGALLFLKRPQGPDQLAEHRSRSRDYNPRLDRYRR